MEHLRRGIYKIGEGGERVPGVMIRMVYNGVVLDGGWVGG